MIPMGDCGVATVLPMNMIGCVCGAGMARCAGCRISGCDFKAVLGHVTWCILVMQMTIVQVIDMTIMLDSGVATGGAMNVIVMSAGMSHLTVFQNGDGECSIRELMLMQEGSFVERNSGIQVGCSAFITNQEWS